MPDVDAETSNHSRIVLLNYLQSKSVSKAPREFKAPVHSALQLLNIVHARVEEKVGVEYFDSEDDDDEDVRREFGKGKSRIWLKKKSEINDGDYTYLMLLVEKLNHRSTKFPVVDVETMIGRHLVGKANDIGAETAHMIVRVPANGKYEDGFYRCAIEYTKGITRHDIETYLCRQLRRTARQGQWTFDELKKSKKGKVESKRYQYRPRLELIADLGKGIKLSLVLRCRQMVHRP